MRDSFSAEQGYAAIGISPGIYSSKDVEMVLAVCRGDLSQIDRALEGTPFVAVDDRFVVSLSNFGANSGRATSYWDGSIVFSVRFGKYRGGFYYRCYENTAFAVASGRELWGYNKLFADFDVESTPDSYRGEVSLRGQDFFTLEFTPDDAVNDDESRDLRLYPHLCLRGVHDPVNWGFQKLEVLTRDTSPDIKIKSRQFGRARVAFGDTMTVEGDPLKVIEVLSAERRIADFASTEKNGRSKVIADLLAHDKIHKWAP